MLLHLMTSRCLPGILPFEYVEEVDPFINIKTTNKLNNNNNDDDKTLDQKWPSISANLNSI